MTYVPTHPLCDAGTRSLSVHRGRTTTSQRSCQSSAATPRERLAIRAKVAVHNQSAWPSKAAMSRALTAGAGG